jgi:hypothetical protein
LTEEWHGQAGLPDGIFSNQKFTIGINFGGFEVDNVGIFYAHLEYIASNWYRYFMGTWQLSGNLVYSPTFWYIVSRIIWQPCGQGSAAR